MFGFVESTKRSSLPTRPLLTIAPPNGLLTPPFHPPVQRPSDQMLLRIILPSLALAPVSIPPLGRLEMTTLFSSHIFCGPRFGSQLKFRGRDTLYTTLWSTTPPAAKSK